MPPQTKASSAQHTSLACISCRRLKMKCIRSDANPSCDRCVKVQRQCQLPEARPAGRKPGSTNRYHGVEKALHNLKTQLTRSGMEPSADNQQIIDAITAHLDKTPSWGGHSTSVRSISATEYPHDQGVDHENEAAIDFEVVLEKGTDVRPKSATDPSRVLCPSSRTQMEPHGASTMLTTEPSRRKIHSDPLWLIADAARAAQSTSATEVSDTLESSQTLSHELHQYAGRLLASENHISLGLRLKRETLQEGLAALLRPPVQSSRFRDYFKLPDVQSLRDLGPEFDPIDQGLVSMEEARSLFPVYFEKVNPINGILDPGLHTPEFVRSRSALLFTWILAITAQFQPDCAGLAKRLRLHGEKLCRKVHTAGLRSTDIVQGYYISLHMASPATSVAEERSWLYTSHASALASHLYLDQPCRRPMTDTGASDDVEYQRLVRNRERTWFRMLLWERANNAVSNKMDQFPDNDLVRNVETWWLHPLATSTDRYTAAFITLRRLLPSLYSELKRKAHEPQPNPHWVRDSVESALAFWQRTWMSPTSATESTNVVPDIYLRYVYLHARLWALSFDLNEHTATGLALPENSAIIDDCFQAALKCCEVFVRDMHEVGEPLHLLMAPTWAMVSYAAVLAFKLCPYVCGNQPVANVELLALLSQVASQLEQAGTTPSTRYGIAALYGQHLRTILRTQVPALMVAAVGAMERHDENLRANIPPITAEAAYAGSFGEIDPFVSVPAFDGQSMWSAMDDCADILNDLFGPGYDTINEEV